jgi:predicted nuclease of predicted toxin-antitoxin system
MNIWLDAQLSPAIAGWLTAQFQVSATALRDLGLRDSTDREVFLAARQAGAVVMTKDEDFVLLLESLGGPPQIVWLTGGNTLNAELKRLLTDAGRRTFELLESGEPLVEISGT